MNLAKGRSNVLADPCWSGDEADVQPKETLSVPRERELMQIV